MGTELRGLTRDDSLTHRRLMSHAFGQGRVVLPPEPETEPSEPMEGVWGVFKDGALRAALSVQPYTVHWGGSATLAMGGIAGVATWAEARGRGHVDALLRQSLRAMKDAGQTVSALYPFAWGFYRRYGWDWVGEQRKAKIPLRELRSAPEGREVASIGGAEDTRARLTPAYTAFARGYRGVFAAECHQWDRFLRDDDSRTTYAYAYPPTGEYLLWRYDKEGGNGRVREWVAHTPEGYRALLSLLHYLGTQCKTAEVILPGDSPLWSHLMHWDLETKSVPVFMGRVVDLAGALAALPPAPGVPDGALTLAVRDEHAPWNDGTWRIAIEGGKIAAAPVAGAAGAADIALDIQTLSQAFWGTPSLTDLRRAGRVIVSDEAAFVTLAAILPSAPVFTLDDF